MLKIIVLLVFAYNLYMTVNNPTMQDWIINGTLLLIGLGLVVGAGKKILAVVIKVVAVVALVGYALMKLGVLEIQM